VKKQLLAMLLCIGLASIRLEGAEVHEPAVAVSGIDLAATRSIGGNGADAIAPTTLPTLLNLQGAGSRWKAATSGDANEGSFHYRLAFKQPVTLGAFLAEVESGAGGSVVFRALKADAAYPGDPARDADWEPLAATKTGNHHDVACATGFATRALLCTQTGSADPPTIRRWNLFKNRLFNLTPYAVAQGDSGPFGADPSRVIQGGAWQNTGPDREGKYIVPPVSSVNPSWFTLVWEKPQALSAVRLLSNADQFLLFAFEGSDRANPALASDKDWQRVRFEEAFKQKTQNETECSVTFPTVTTRALKLVILETHPRERRAAMIREFSALTDLGNRPLPAPPSTTETPPPVAISYSLPRAGDAALVIDDAHGRRVRNLFAQVPRQAGKNVDPWDLKDDNGVTVPPGEYRWKVISAPPLELHYQMTPYPNVEQHSPESSPWWTGAPKSGWLSNHGNQSSVCVVGETVYQGAGGTEGGHAFIETDYNGAKKWGTGDPAQSMFTDGKTLFIRQGDSVARYDAATRTRKPLFTLNSTAERKGTPVGLAALNNKIYVAFSSPVPYLDNAGDTSMVDIEHCEPKLPATLKRSDNYGIPVSPQRDFLSLFRLGGHINGDDRANGLMLRSTKGTQPQQHIVLTLKANRAIGSLVFPRPEQDHPDVKFRISVLKPDAPYPPQPNTEAHWTEVKLGKLAAWNCVPLPAETSTRALRFTFFKPSDALLDALDIDLANPAKSGQPKPARKRDEWFGRIEGMRILRMRLKGLLSEAKIRVNSGTINTATGEWDAERTEILSERKPAIYAMEWDQPRKVRGLAIKEIDGARTEIDVYVGSATGAIDISGDDGWQNVATYHQPRRNYYQPDSSNNALARYLDGVVDFHRDWETRAVRLRIVSQWGEQPGRPEGVRSDRGGRTIDPKRCRVYGVTPVEYIGGEPPVDRMVVQRLGIYDGDTGKFEQELPSSITGAIAFNPAGELFGIQDGAVVKGNAAKGDAATAERTKFITDLQEPRLLTFDGKGRLYVYDHGPDRRVVRVYDADGKHLHDIGRTGPQKPGPYDPTRFGDLCAISTDPAGDNIWMVYPHEDPRRVMRFKTDGTHLQDYFGGANYGGGGVLDPHDKSRFWFKNMLFDLDWAKGTTRLKALVSMKYEEASVWGGEMTFRTEWVPIRYLGRTYLVSAPLSHQPTMPAGAVFLFDDKTSTVRMVAAMGAAASFPYVRTVEAQEKLNGEPFGRFNFIWIDRSGDGQVQSGEVEFTPRAQDAANLGPFDRELGAMAGNTRYEVKQLLPDGTPVFEARQMPFAAHLRLNNGNYFRFGDAGKANEVLSPRGERIWSYKAHLGMDGLNVPPWSPGLVDLQFGIAGHAVAGTGDLGEFFVIHANNGQMNIWTADGLLAGHVTHHTRDPRAKGWPEAHARGTRLDGLTLGQEHFHHYFCRTEQDNKYYLVGSSTSVIEVRGIEKFTRDSGEFQVTPTMLEQTQQWEATRLRKIQFARPPIIDCTRGTIPETSSVGAITASEISDLGKFWMGYDAGNLYLKWSLRTDATGPFRNGGDDFRRAFKTGTCVDFQMGADAAADTERGQPVAGDLRVVVTVLNDKPVAVLYRPVAPRAPKQQAWATTTIAGGTTSFDQVVILKDAVITVSSAGGETVVSAALPLQELGLKPVIGATHRMDWGVLSSRDGNLTTARKYWANATASGTTDEPTEARLTPNLWGFVRFQSSRTELDLKPKIPRGKDDIDDLLDSKLEKKP
jgi:hypothetical protein